MEELQAENERLKERIKNLEFELKIMSHHTWQFFTSLDYNPFEFDDDDWKLNINVCARLHHPIFLSEHDIFNLKNEEKTDYYLNIRNGIYGIHYTIQNVQWEPEDLTRNLTPFLVYLINQDHVYLKLGKFQSPIVQNVIKAILEDTSKFHKHVQDIFNSVMIDSKILYWDANIFSIIQLYLCLPYHWNEFKSRLEK